MMEQAKPENNTTTATEPSPEPTAPSVTKTNASAEERVQDLERRLNLLGNEGSAGGASVASGSTASSSSPAAANPTTAPSQPAKNNPLLVRWIFEIYPICASMTCSLLVFFRSEFRFCLYL